MALFSSWLLHSDHCVQSSWECSSLDIFIKVSISLLGPIISANIFSFFCYNIRIKKIKRPGAFFLVNLAVADLFKVVASIPLYFVSSLYGEWVFGQIGI